MKYCYVLWFIISLVCWSCSSSNKVKDGLTAHRYKQYAIAVDMLKKEYERSDRKEDRSNIAYLVGDSYTYLNRYQEANEWFSISEREKFNVKALVGLAETYENLEKYDKALAAYEELKKELPGDQRILRKISTVKQAIQWKYDATDNYSFRKLIDRGFSANYSPVLYENNYLVFTSDHQDATGSDSYNWTGHKKSDLFIVNKQGAGEIRKFDSFINSKDNDGTAVFSQDFSLMVFTRCFSVEAVGDDYCKLMQSTRENGVWTEPQPLPFIKNNVNYGQPCLIENDEVLVFSSRSEDGANGYDLWYSVFEDGTWSEPFPMPNSINTQGNEHFPTADGDTLYFSSDYLPGMGGLDVFKTFLQSDGSWAAPVNLKPPFNSGADDFGLLIDRQSKEVGEILRGYITTTRSYDGYEDIYEVKLFKSSTKDTNDPVAVEDDDKSAIALYLAGKVMTYEYNIENDPNSGVKRKTNIASPYVKVIDAQGQEIKVNGNNRGLFIGDIKKGITYTIIAKKQGFLNNTITVNSDDFSIPDDEPSYTVNVEVVLEPIFKGKEIILDNIYYDLDESFIRDDAKPTLNNLAKILNDNPQISIELMSHTDCQGEDDYNQALSQRRAQSAVEYLQSQGIASDRMRAKGYGETRLLEACECSQCTDDQHQTNRRTSFVIL